MEKSTTSREFAQEDLAVLPGVGLGGDHEMSENAYPRVKTHTLEVLVFSVFAGKI